MYFTLGTLRHYDNYNIKLYYLHFTSFKTTHILYGDVNELFSEWNQITDLYLKLLKKTYL